jgi:hypothetical protein
MTADRPNAGQAKARHPLTRAKGGTMTRNDDESNDAFMPSRKPNSLLLPRWGFDWGELAAVATGLELLPPAAELIAAGGRYYADHLSASRHIVTLLWDHTRRELASGFRDPDRRIESRLYEVMARLTRAEAAIMQAECVRIRPLHGNRDAAHALLDAQIQSLQDSVDQVSGAVDLLDGIWGDQTIEISDRDQPKEATKEKEPATSLAQDALEQVKLLLKTIQDIVDALAPKKKHDDIADLIQKLAKLIANGTRAAIAGAIAALVEAIDSDASAKDIILIPGKDGEVTIWFRVRKGCLFFFDWAVDDDYVFVRKTGKGAVPAIATGKSAKALEKAVQEKLAKELDKSSGGAGASPSSPAPGPAPAKKYF